ncbi:uncharacterized protein LOC111600079 [Drosophila hydei]|uniref:Beta-1,4-glucuronyltransferase 1 n=1 Tax=Drosophila hydei TaxID=7224 RepID=A0A6J1M4P0_DROHY|nr:uncharacterized protein LOC111600079 [Drosophila hydei]
MFRLPHGSLTKILIVLLFVNILLLVKVYPPYKSVTNGSNTHPTSTYVQKTKATVPLNCPYHSDIGTQVTMSTLNLDHFISESNITKLTFANIDISYGRWDNQHKYKIKDFAVVGEQYTESSKISLICLATQSSVERLYSLPQVAANWIGPISVALFSAGNEEYIVLKYFVTNMKTFQDI